MAWIFPEERYYYGWLDQPWPIPEPNDAEIKSAVVARLRENPQTKDSDIRIDVKQNPGVVDVSNQLVPAGAAGEL